MSKRKATDRLNQGEPDTGFGNPPALPFDKLPLIRDIPFIHVKHKPKNKRTPKPKKPSLKIVSYLEDKLKDLTQGLPEDFRGRADALMGITHACRQHFAGELAPALNAEVRAMPHADLDGKKAVCDFVNGELERLGLAVKCPKTGLPAKLKGNAGNWPEIGRFAFEVYIDGKRERSAYSDKLPELQLIDANPANELESGWQAKVGPKASRHGRKLTD
jgi:hypothetical protein